MTPAGFVGRVGGLAAALGAGVVVVLAGAGPASADDSGAGDSGPRAAAAEHSAGRASSAAAAATRRVDAGRPAAVIAGDRGSRSISAAAISEPTAVAAQVARKPAAAAARASRPEARPSAAVVTPAAAAPVTVIAPAPAAVAPVVAPSAAPVASAPAPASAAASLSSLLCDPRGRLITVFKGTHFVIPGSPAFFVKQVTGTGTFTPNSAYDLKDVDQYDWNKFTGIAFSPLQHDRNSVMVGWRYNLTTKEYEIAPFYNVNKERILPNEQTEVISVPADATFQYRVDYTGVTISYGDKTVFKPYPPGLTPNIWTSTRVSGWFGGNEAAPRTLSYYLSLK